LPAINGLVMRLSMCYGVATEIAQCQLGDLTF